MSFDKRYTVISVPSPSGPEYRIYDRLNECSIEGGFDTQKWAEAVAEMMEKQYREKKGCVRCKTAWLERAYDTYPSDDGIWEIDE